jgi:hypothetical protein
MRLYVRDRILQPSSSTSPSESSSFPAVAGASAVGRTTFEEGLPDNSPVTHRIEPQLAGCTTSLQTIEMAYTICRIHCVLYGAGALVEALNAQPLT